MDSGLPNRYLSSLLLKEAAIALHDDISNELVEFIAARKDAATGEGQGQGNPPEGVGGTDKCYCPKCGATAEHSRGTPCNEMKCPSCGATMTGVAQKEASVESSIEDQLAEVIEQFATGAEDGRD